MPYHIIRKFSGEMYLLLGRFRPNFYFLGEMYAFWGRFRPKIVRALSFIPSPSILIIQHIPIFSWKALFDLGEEAFWGDDFLQRGAVCKDVVAE